VFDPANILQELNRAGVEYVVIGGIAATLHGCPEQTYDLDILYAPTEDNRRRLLLALNAMGAEWEAPLTPLVLQRQYVFSLNTKFGDLDIFTSAAGITDYATAVSSAENFRWREIEAKVLDLDTLIISKETAGDRNPRKQAALAFLKEIRKRRS
jgi:hypothetical protein